MDTMPKIKQRHSLAISAQRSCCSRLRAPCTTIGSLYTHSINLPEYTHSIHLPESPSSVGRDKGECVVQHEFLVTYCAVAIASWYQSCVIYSLVSVLRFYSNITQMLNLQKFYSATNRVNLNIDQKSTSQSLDRSRVREKGWEG